MNEMPIEFRMLREMTHQDAVHVGVDRAEARDVLALHLAGYAPGLHQAGLKPSALPSEADEHGVVA